MVTIDEVVTEKISQWEQLTQKLAVIDVHSLYFHDGLNMEEHLKYATLGVFYLERDIRYYNEWYK
tara:strand:+ start:530 stop:724 length:195 start_codon:yes stop_codon:yes gene_type:complete